MVEKFQKPKSKNSPSWIILIKIWKVWWFLKKMKKISWKIKSKNHRWNPRWKIVSTRVKIPAKFKRKPSKKKFYASRKILGGKKNGYLGNGQENLRQIFRDQRKFEQFLFLPIRNPHKPLVFSVKMEEILHQLEIFSLFRRILDSRVESLERILLKHFWEFIFRF